MLLYFLLFFYDCVFVLFCFLIFWPCLWDLIPRPEIEPVSPAVEAQNLNHWTTREVLLMLYFKN